MLVVGVLGAFTTFSTFSMDTYVLFERGQTAAMLGYVAASVLVCVFAFWGGLALCRQFLP